MQPPTEPTPAGPQKRPKPRGDEDELYRRHHRALHRSVACVVRAPHELIEDACQTAWTILLRNQPDRRSIFGWLRVVVNHTFDLGPPECLSGGFGGCRGSMFP